MYQENTPADKLSTILINILITILMTIVIIIMSILMSNDVSGTYTFLLTISQTQMGLQTEEQASEIIANYRGQVCMNVYDVCMNICMYCMYLCIYVCMYVCMYDFNQIPIPFVSLPTTTCYMRNYR